MPVWIDRVRYLLRRKSLRSRDRRLGVLASGLEKIFRSSPSTLSDQDFRAIEKLLVRTGNQCLTGVGRVWWSAFSEAVTANEAGFPDKEATLLAIGAEASGDGFNSDDWLELYRICLISGLYTVGVGLRRRAEIAALIEAEPSSASEQQLRRALSVLIETGRFSEARSMLARLQKTESDPKLVEHGYWLVSLLANEAPTPLVRPEEFSAESKMLEALQGSSVALVGPVPTDAENGHEIDSFDLVAKFNYRGGSGGLDPATQGKRVDISYYNIQQSKHIARNTDASFLSSVPFPVFIKDKGLRLLGQYATNGRVLKNLQRLLFDSELNAGPNAIFDLLRFTPATVKVFNTDFMLTAGRYKGYSQPGGEEINYSHSFAKTHDPLMQFRWARLAWSRGLIDGDDRFREVLGYDESTYITRLQEGHGGIARENLTGRAR